MAILSFQNFPPLNLYWACWFHFPVIIQVDFQLIKGRQREKERGRQTRWKKYGPRSSGPESKEEKEGKITANLWKGLQPGGIKGAE